MEATKEMDIKVNYLHKWDDEGYHYTQTVTIALTAAQMAEINAKISELSFARYLGRRFFISGGMNFVTLSSARIIAEYIGAVKSNRYKTDRNTAFNIIVA